MSQRWERKTKAIKVEELPWFPFATFQEFRDACRDGLCYVAVDRGAALSWVHGGKYATVASSLLVTTLTFIPYLAVLGFVGYSLFTGSWLWLLALPLFVIAYVLFYPAWGFLRVFGYGAIRSLPIWLSVLGFVWGVLTEWPALVTITGVLLTIWLSHLAVDKQTTHRFKKAITDHEDLLCAAWRRRAFAIRFTDGRIPATFFVDSLRDRSALLPDIARNDFDEMFPKALEGDKRALAQLSDVLGFEVAPDMLRSMDADALRDLYVTNVRSSQ